MSTANPRALRYATRSLLPLDQNPHHSFAARYALSIYGSDAVLSFIPKNACSTLRYTIGVANGAIAGPEAFNWIHHNNATFRPSLRDLARAKYTFAVLRDPYARLASCYFDKMVDQTPVAWRFHALTGYETSPAMLTFRAFASRVGPHLRADEHWRPQVDFLVYRTYDDYFCVEAFPDAEAALQDRIGLSVLDARHLTRHGTDLHLPLDGDASFADQPAHAIADLKRAGRIPRIQSLYDPSIVSTVAKLYADDVAFYIETLKRPCLYPTP